MLAPPTPTTASASEKNGQALFSSTGCALCHSPSLTTAASTFTGMGNFTYHPYSDIALHHLGPKLADGVSQGSAGGDEFRTAPLWGIGQRLFFLHDGRTSDLLDAIQQHSSPGADCVENPLLALVLPCQSEANGVISKFNALNASQQQDLLNFLRSL
jgi:CxxC motif-containing protein (DUF1111 family)